MRHQQVQSERSRRLFRIAAGGLAIAGAFVAGIALRDPITKRFAAYRDTAATAPTTRATSSTPTARMWTCSMHPQVIQDHPGQCPICHMTLTPMSAAAHMTAHTDEAKSAAVTIDAAMVQRMGVRTSLVQSGKLTRIVRAVGTLDEPEPMHRDINLRVSGWIQKLYANVDGMPIEEGKPLFDLYSPEMNLAIEELIASRKQRSGDATMLDAARAKLSRMGLPDEQISDFAKLEAAPATVPILSPSDGHLTAKMVNDGSAVKAGDLVMRIADRTMMWADLQVFEQDLPFVHVGQDVALSLMSEPGKPMTGRVSFIHPHLAMMTRTALVRVELPNVSHRLREGMYVVATIQSQMPDDALLVPREAVIDTGTRQIAFIRSADGTFEPRELKLGASGGDGSVEVISGLKAGESVVTSGQFLIDSESRTQEAIAKLRGSHAAMADGGDAR